MGSKELLYILILGLVSTLPAQILSQWRGINRDGIYLNEKLLKTWPVEGPALLWSVSNIGAGFSSPAVTPEGVYVTGMKNGKGYIFAFNHSGKLLWKKEYGAEWTKSQPGSYVCSVPGMVVCLNAGNGTIIWKVDLVDNFGARHPIWGITESLLIDGDRLFCTPGGKNVLMAVLDRHTGKTIQTINGNGEISAYCSPVLIKHGNRRLILTMTKNSVVGIDAQSDKFLWHYPHQTRGYVNPNTPLYYKGQVYTVSGEGKGGQLFNLAPDGKSMKRIWADKTLDSFIGAAVLIDGFIYGSGHRNRGWHCIEWATGKVNYTAKELGNRGNIISADSLLYLYSVKGDVGLVEPNPEKFDVISTFKIQKGSGPHWAHLVIGEGRLYVRHGNVLMVYDISG